jgi:hypothetical protein
LSDAWRQPVANALMVGFAAVREDAMNSGMELLAAAIESTKRVERPRNARAADFQIAALIARAEEIEKSRTRLL